jgi:ElaA protein
MAASPIVATDSQIHRALWAQLGADTVHDLIQLRVNVFVVEQGCAYQELDGRDIEPQTEHLWTADKSGPTAYLRVMTDADGSARIGRVCTRADARGAGLAAELIRAALEDVGGRVVVLEAQEHLTGWYERFGFVTTGPSYLEDGISHVPMRREPVTQT